MDGEASGPLATGVLYHVIVRGNQRQKTLSDSDYQAYLERITKRYFDDSGFTCIGGRRGSS